MSINQNFPEVSPSLLLDFANSRTLDPKITFTRSSIGTYVASNGLIKTAAADEARFDHDPETGESLGLLIEENRTNLLQRSKEFNDVYWTKEQLTITTNAVNSPAGDLTADALIESTTTDAVHYIIRYFSAFSGYITLSVYVKPKGSRNFHIGMWDGGAGGDAIIDLSDGSVVSSTSGTTIVQQLNNGWYRVSYTRYRASATGSPYFQFEPYDENFNRTYTGDGSSGLYLWGAQLEAGSFPTSYIPTSGSQVTRQPDNASITGTNFSDWYNQNEGTLYVESDGYGSGGYSRLVSLSNENNYANRIVLFRNAASPNQNTNLSYHITQNSVTTTNITFAPGGSNTKIALTYQSNDAKIALNSNIVGTDNDTTIPTVKSLGIGLEEAAGRFNGLYKKLTYYPQRLTDSQLQNLTK
jgi:hypothetical protein